jgi:hypothetical protein
VRWLSMTIHLLASAMCINPDGGTVTGSGTGPNGTHSPQPGEN